MPIEVPATKSTALASQNDPTPLSEIEIRLRTPRFTASDRTVFTERLELLLQTGTPLHDSLDSLAGQMPTGIVRDTITDLRESVAGGATFSQALARHPEVFSSTYVNLVAAGESGGFLPRVLARLCEMDQRRAELRSTLVGAFTYPAFLMVFCVAVVIFVLVVVFPKFTEIFEAIKNELPITTRFLMALSDSLRSRVWIWLAAAAAIAGGIWRLLRTESGREALDRVLLRIPFTRDILVQLQLVQFLMVMSLSLENGVPMLDSLRACRDVASSPVFRRFVTELEQRVSEGQPFASAFTEAPWLPELVPQMIATGEASGSLAPVMQRVAEFYEREWRRKLALVAKTVEPAMLVVMGVVVGLIVSSILLPIFKLSTAVH